MMHASLALIALAFGAGSGVAAQSSPMPGTATPVAAGTPLAGTGTVPAAAGTPPPGTSPAGSGTSPGASPGPSPVGGKTITPHPDGNCMNALGAGAATSIPIDAQFPAFNTTHQPIFPGAAAPGGGGWNVWWNIADPPQGCRTVVMKPYSQNRGTPGLPGGKEMINVGRGGCYFAQIPPETDILASTCCGSACTNASLNSTDLLAAPTKRSVDLSRHMHRRKAKADTEAKREAEAAAKQNAEAPVKREMVESIQRETAEEEQREHTGSPVANAKRYWYPMPAANPGCNFTSPNQPYSQAGQQVIVTSTQYCAQSPCTIAVSSQVSFSTTLTSSKSQTITNSVGLSTSITAGVDFFADATVTDTFSYDFSVAIAHTTGQDVSRGNSTTITNTLALALGNSGAVTFTPVYTCYTGTFDCGKGASDPVDVCQPNMGGAGNSLLGEYDAIVYNG